MEKIASESIGWRILVAWDHLFCLAGGFEGLVHLSLYLSLPCVSTPSSTTSSFSSSVNSPFTMAWQLKASQGKGPQSMVSLWASYSFPLQAGGTPYGALKVLPIGRCWTYSVLDSGMHLQWRYFSEMSPVPIHFCLEPNPIKAVGERSWGRKSKTGQLQPPTHRNQSGGMPMTIALWTQRKGQVLDQLN